MQPEGWYAHTHVSRRVETFPMPHLHTPPTPAPPTPTGGLPTTWAGSFKPLRKLVTLDLSFNYLGLDGSRLPNEWGSAARINPFAALQTLRLSNNYFGGAWGGGGVGLLCGPVTHH